MSRYVYECVAFNQNDGTCSQAVFVPRSDFPELKPAEALELLSYVALAFVCAWGWKKLGLTVRF